VVSSDERGLSAAEYARRFRAWLAQNAGELASHRSEHPEYGARVANLRALQARLWDAGWARWGWPERFGGRGGDELHRAAFYEALADAGYPPRSLLEHLEIVAPTLARFADEKLVAGLLPATLRADTIWCQGFSEPGAGSDLAALRTRAERVPGGFRINGHKIWTSWALWADRCLVLARTGPVDARHRALSMFAVDMGAPGVQCNAIRQANGTDELAEVFFDDVEIDGERLVGPLDRGWEVAMYLLSCERGAYGWQRHLFLYPRLAALAERAGERASELGGIAVDAFGLRVRAWSTLRQLASGQVPGPEAAVAKVLTTDLEQHSYDAALRIAGPGLSLGSMPGAWRWQEEYLFSRAVSIYGGTRQIQLNTIARHLLRPAGSEPGGEYAELLGAIRTALRGSANAQDALEALGWWETVRPGTPGDALLALGALFEAQGRERAQSPALGALLAAEVLEAGGVAAGLRGSAALRIEPASGGQLRVWLPACADRAEQIALWLPSGAAARVAAARCALEPAPALDPQSVWVGELDPADLGAVELDPAAGARALALGRVCLAFEILGACEGMFALALEHAGTREQFGRPLVEYQAVQHLLAEAHLARAALRAACETALARVCAGALEPELAALAKALAGRSARALGERTLQVLGAIGFTDEHLHHRFYRRALTLDAMLGSGDELALDLGGRIAREGRVPRGPGIEDLPGAA
jgi:alkylation response protein AidB-like acyl-CoA dehydrogenase